MRFCFYWLKIIKDISTCNFEQLKCSLSYQKSLLYDKKKKIYRAQSADRHFVNPYNPCTEKDMQFVKKSTLFNNLNKIFIYLVRFVFNLKPI